VRKVFSLIRHHRTRDTDVAAGAQRSLRKAGARTDPYRVFRDMLVRGRPPTDWDSLVTACEAWTRGATGDPD
jgi:hypothetical protein